MQQNGGMRKYHLLRVFGAWALVPGLGVPATKFVESYYDVSLFSPAIVKLWQWLMSGWDWLVRDISIPFWVLMPLVILILALSLPVALLVYVRCFDKKGQPTGSPLKDDQNRMFVVVGQAIQHGCGFGFDEILETSGLSRIATQNALDHLYRVGLIRPAREAYGSNFADLTPLGREHYLELEEAFRE